MELVDLYDENRIPLGRTAERHDQLPAGAYRTVVHVCIFNRRGELEDVEDDAPGYKAEPEELVFDGFGGGSDDDYNNTED